VTISERLADVRERIRRAAEAAGRDPLFVGLVAVSKTQPPERIRAAYDAGQRDFGENYVQELRSKQEALSDLAGIRWHFIGHLQRNKARQVVGRVALVQTVDSLGLLEELGKRAVAAGTEAEILLQVDVAGEETKSGCSPEELRTLVTAARERPGVRLRGLMAIPPWEDEPEGSRRHFVALRELRDGSGGTAALPELSMGMSGDFEVAVEEGATIVRVGTAIFGARR
jgi:pyridoxal phosphate enzyme (YggS family)